MIFRAASCQKAARCCYGLQRTEMPISVVRDDYGQNFTILKDSHIRNDFDGNTRKLLAVITL